MKRFLLLPQRCFVIIKEKDNTAGFLEGVEISVIPRSSFGKNNIINHVFYFISHSMEWICIETKVMDIENKIQQAIERLIDSCVVHGAN